MPHFAGLDGDGAYVSGMLHKPSAILNELQPHFPSNSHPDNPTHTFQSSTIYRELLEKALSDALESATKERLAAATKIKKLQHERQSTLAKLRKVQRVVADGEGGHLREIGNWKARVAELERVREALGRELEEVRAGFEEELKREKENWALASAEEMCEKTKEWLGIAAEQERETAREHEVTQRRIEGTEKALAEARHLLHHFEVTAGQLRKEVDEAREEKRVVELAMTGLQASFQRYRRMVGDAVEGAKDFSHERRRRHSGFSPPAQLRLELQRASLSTTDLPPLPSEAVDFAALGRHTSFSSTRSLASNPMECDASTVTEGASAVVENRKVAKAGRIKVLVGRLTFPHPDASPAPTDPHNVDEPFPVPAEAASSEQADPVDPSSPAPGQDVDEAQPAAKLRKASLSSASSGMQTRTMSSLESPPTSVELGGATVERKKTVKQGKLRALIRKLY